MIRFAGVGWAASVTVTGDAKPKYGWLGGALQVGVDDLLSGNLVSGSQVENAAVNQKMMNVRLGVGIYNPAPDGITVDVCPGNQDWKVDMLNEEAENIHARVFKSERAKIAVVAFRGTQLASTKNWHVDADIKRVRMDLGSGNSTMVHEGFLNALDAVLPQVKRWCDGYVFGLVDAVPEDWSLIFTGHSLGGALALLAATRAETEGWNRRPTATVVFGAPRVADASLDRWWQSQGMCNKLIRVNAYNDAVHWMPFQKMWSAWQAGNGAVGCVKNLFGCIKHETHDLLHGSASDQPVISQRWAHVCPKSEFLVPSAVKGVNEKLTELSLFGGLLAHLLDNCKYGYSFGVLNSKLGRFDEYCNISTAICPDPSIFQKIARSAS
ncbi:unnamed protein product [Polarella glacialis]|uniref:Fungal lipase-type domain-containing protein n=1 Tax=Polarella glacialis TaxID=89957 RepID=A0A813JIK1_POLGL|nr:unnamed protein product [Polarella glacialis]